MYKNKLLIEIVHALWHCLNKLINCFSLQILLSTAAASLCCYVMSPKTQVSCNVPCHVYQIQMFCRPSPLHTQNHKCNVKDSCTHIKVPSCVHLIQMSSHVLQLQMNRQVSQIHVPFSYSANPFYLQQIQVLYNVPQIHINHGSPNPSALLCSSKPGAL